jgi:hypothetical protein
VHYADRHDKDSRLPKALRRHGRLERQSAHTCDSLVVDAFQISIHASIDNPLKIALIVLNFFQAAWDECLVEDLHIVGQPLLHLKAAGCA